MPLYGRSVHRAGAAPLRRVIELAVVTHRSRISLMALPPPLPNSTGTHAKLRKELCVFFIALSVLLAIAAYFSLTGINSSAPPLWGVSRHLAIGFPLALLSAMHLLSGALLAVSGRRFFGLAGAVASTLTTVFFFAFMFSATGTVPINLISIVLFALPILVWSRTGKFLSAAPKSQ